MIITLELIERPNGDIALGIKRPPRYLTAREGLYEDEIVATLSRELPGICKRVAAKERQN